MGAIWLGTRGTCVPHFFRRRDIVCHVSPTFLSQVCIWRGLKNKCDVCHGLCEEFFMLDVTNSHVDVLIFLQIFTSKMIFNILQVSRDRNRLLTASVRHLSSVVYCKKGHCLETVKFNGYTRERPQYSRDLFRAKTLANWLYQAITLVVTYSEIDSAKFEDGSV